MIIIAGVLQRRFKKFLKKHEDVPNTQQEDTCLQAIYKNLPFLALLIAESLLAIFYVIQNGILFFFIAPMRFWGILLSIFLFYQAHWKISDKNFEQSALICSPDSKLATS
jgi:Na+/melibiose symporter-like transporter